jgi:hypothetical protein
MCEVATRALKAVWFQKWFVHMRLRPEVFACRVDRTQYHGRAMNAGLSRQSELLPAKVIDKERRVVYCAS